MASVFIRCVAWHVGDYGQTVKVVAPVRDEKGNMIEMEVAIESSHWPKEEYFGKVGYEMYNRLLKAKIFNKDDFGSFKNIELRWSMGVKDRTDKEQLKVY